MLFTVLHFFEELLLESVDTVDVRRNFVFFVYFQRFVKLTCKLVLKGPLIGFQVEFPAVKICQLKVADVVDFQKGVKVLKQVKIIFFFEHFLGKVSNLSQTSNPRDLPGWIVPCLTLFLLVKLKKIKRYHIFLEMGRTLAIAEDLRGVSLDAQKHSFLEHVHRKVLEGQLQKEELDRVEEILIFLVATGLLKEGEQLVLTYLLLLKQVRVEKT